MTFIKKEQKNINKPKVKDKQKQHRQAPVNSSFYLSGLSLVEMVISLAVVMFIATIFIFNYQGNNKRTDLIMASQVMVSDIHRAQNNALGLLKYGEETPLGGWGIYFDLNQPDTYVIFPDLEAPGDSGYLGYDSETEGDVNLGTRIIELVPEIVISDLRFLGGSSQTSAVVTFLPPDPITNIYSNGSTSTALYVDITDLRNDKTKTILVNFLGLAEVIN